MLRREFIQENRMEKFEEVYGRWKAGEIGQRTAAVTLRMSERTFRRYRRRWENEGVEGLRDRRIGRRGSRGASREEIRALEALYRDCYEGRNVRHFYEAYTELHGGVRSYSWVKDCLHAASLVKRGRRRGPYRQCREREGKPGDMLHQDASWHFWVPGQRWDLVVTMDDATGEIYSMFFVAQEGMWSSMRGVREVLERRGIFRSLYTDRGSHYWTTREAGGDVDRDNPTQFGRAMAELGIEMIAARSPQARGRSERMFGTLQKRLPQELKEAGITDMEEANEFVAHRFLPDFNRRFTVPAREAGEGFVPVMRADLDNILCRKETRKVGNDNCVRYKNRRLQLPRVTYRNHFVRHPAVVHEYRDGSMGVHDAQGRLVGKYDSEGRLVGEGPWKRKPSGSRRQRSASASSGYALGC